MSMLGRALAAYQQGRRDAVFTVTRDDGFVATVAVETFFAAATFPALESRALDLCRGDVLDVGAGAGRHTLELLRRGLAVWSMDVVPEACAVLKERGAPHPVQADILTWEGRAFDTVLMLMNGIGLVGTPQGLDAFLRRAPRIVSPGGQILCDSMDVFVPSGARHDAYRETNIAAGRSPGQQRFRIGFDGVAGEFFDWLHIDFELLSNCCRNVGFDCERIVQEDDGHYLARIQVRPT